MILLLQSSQLLHERICAGGCETRGEDRFYILILLQRIQNPSLCRFCRGFGTLFLQCGGGSSDPCSSPCPHRLFTPVSLRSSMRSSVARNMKVWQKQAPSWSDSFFRSSCKYGICFLHIPDPHIRILQESHVVQPFQKLKSIPILRKLYCGACKCKSDIPGMIRLSPTSLQGIPCIFLRKFSKHSGAPAILTDNPGILCCHQLMQVFAVADSSFQCKGF